MELNTLRQEFADPRQFVQAGFTYASYQLLQLVLTATFVPTADPRAFDVAQECMKAFITLCDCLGLYRMFAPRRMAQVCPRAGSGRRNAIRGLKKGFTNSCLKHATLTIYVDRARR